MTVNNILWVLLIIFGIGLIITFNQNREINDELINVRISNNEYKLLNEIYLDSISFYDKRDVNLQKQIDSLLLTFSKDSIKKNKIIKHNDTQQNNLNSANLMQVDSVIRTNLNFR